MQTIWNYAIRFLLLWDALGNAVVVADLQS